MVPWKYRGLAVIIVNTTFDGQSQDDRRGAEEDYRGMLYLFTVLDFEVKALEFRDLKFSDLIKKLDEIKRESKLEDPECFVCVVSSHGKEIHDRKSDTWSPAFYTTDYVQFPVSKLVKHFSDWDAYTGKPKLFFIQACRTRDETDGDSKMYDEGKTLSVIVEASDSRQDDDSTNNVRGRDKADCKARPGPPTTGKQNDKGGLKSGTSSNEQDRGDKRDLDGTALDVPLVSTSIQTPAAAGDMPPVPHDVSMIECPRDCLLMFSVVFGRAALRDDSEKNNTGSWMLRYMYEEQRKITADGRLMPFLTAVADRIALRDFTPDDHNTTTKCSAFIMHRLTTEVRFEPMRADSAMAKQRKKLLKSS